MFYGRCIQTKANSFLSDRKRRQEEDAGPEQFVNVKTRELVSCFVFIVKSLRLVAMSLTLNPTQIVHLLLLGGPNNNGQRSSSRNGNETSARVWPTTCDCLCKVNTTNASDFALVCTRPPSRLILLLASSFVVFAEVLSGKRLSAYGSNELERTDQGSPQSGRNETRPKLAREGAF